MSSSPAAAREINFAIRPFVYPDAWGTEMAGPSLPNSRERSGDGGEGLRAHEQSAIEAARQQGRTEGAAAALENFAVELTRARAGISAALSDFVRERDDYYQKVEAEVVKLALSVARHILHREAQVDPLLLAGLVRVALEKIESRAGTVLRVNPIHAQEWKTHLAQHMQPQHTPEVSEDPTLDLDRCVIETSLGTTEIGIELQLEEIEHGFMDLLAQRPATNREANL